MMADRIDMEFIDTGVAAMKKLGEEAAGCEVDASNAVIDATVAISPILFSTDVPFPLRAKLSVALYSQIWGAGYNKGRQDLQAGLQHGANKG